MFACSKCTSAGNGCHRNSEKFIRISISIQKFPSFSNSRVYRYFVSKWKNSSPHPRSHILSNSFLLVGKKKLEDVFLAEWLLHVAYLCLIWKNAHRFLCEMAYSNDVHCTGICTQTIDYYSCRVLRCDDIFIHSSLPLHWILKQKRKKKQSKSNVHSVVE